VAIKRIAYICSEADEFSFLPLLEYMRNNGIITFQHFSSVTEAVEKFDGLFVVGHGKGRWDSFFWKVSDLSKKLPCIYVWTTQEPEIPGIKAVNINVTLFTSYLELFRQQFKLES